MYLLKQVDTFAGIAVPNDHAAKSPPADEMLLTLQAGRGIAALAVLFHHACNGVLRQGGTLPDWLVTVCGYGYLGVDFFFVLSGFIIYYVNQPRHEREGFARDYLRSRLLRVYVPYLPLGILVALAYLALPHLASGDNDWGWFSTLTLLPSSAYPALAPAWTLQHEILFYGVALVAFLTRSFVKLSLLVVLAAVAVRIFYPLSYKGFGLVDLEFLFGIVAAWCFMNRRANWNAALIVAGLATCGLFFVVDNRFWSVLFGLGLALLLLPLVRAERAGFVKVGPILLLLGEASYALYLIHYPLVAAVARLATRYGSGFSFAIICILSVAVGIAYHLLYERPALALMRRWTARWKHGAAPPMAPLPAQGLAGGERAASTSALLKTPQAKKPVPLNRPEP